MLITIVLIFYTVVFAADYMPRRKENPGRANLVYMAVFLISLCVLLMHSLGVKIPSLSAFIRKGVEAIVGTAQK